MRAYNLGDPHEMRDDPLRHCPELVEAIRAEIDSEPPSILDQPGDMSLARRNFDEPLALAAKAA